MLKKERTVRSKLSLRTALGLAVSFAAVSAASAHDADSKFEMTVVRDAAFGHQIVDGEFGEAIEKITASDRSSERFFSKNNLCVAYTMSAEFEKAAAECESAIEIATAETYLDKNNGYGVMNRHYAMALTNRGVLRAMVGDADKARKDFEEARLLRAGIAAPKRNLRYLEARNARASID